MRYIESKKLRGTLIKQIERLPFGVKDNGRLVAFVINPKDYMELKPSPGVPTTKGGRK